MSIPRETTWGRMIIGEEVILGQFTFKSEAILGQPVTADGEAEPLVIGLGSSYIFEPGSEEDVRLLAQHDETWTPLAAAAEQIRAERAEREERRALQAQQLPLVRAGLPLLMRRLIDEGCYSAGSDYGLDIEEKDGDHCIQLDVPQTTTSAEDLRVVHASRQVFQRIIPASQQEEGALSLDQLAWLAALELGVQAQAAEQALIDREMRGS